FATLLCGPMLVLQRGQAGCGSCSSLPAQSGQTAASSGGVSFSQIQNVFGYTSCTSPPSSCSMACRITLRCYAAPVSARSGIRQNSGLHRRNSPEFRLAPAEFARIPACTGGIRQNSGLHRRNSPEFRYEFVSGGAGQDGVAAGVLEELRRRFV